MNTAAWQAFFAEQLNSHSKALFTSTELANAARTSRHAAQVEVSRLIERGIVQRYAHGIYGLPGAGTIEELLSIIDPAAYLTGCTVLFHAGIVTQVPAELACFTPKRPQHALLHTQLGQIHRHSVRPPVCHPPASGVHAPPEQALCDEVYLLERRGSRLEATVTLRRLDRLRHGALRTALRRYPDYVRRAVERLLEAGGVTPERRSSTQR